MIDTTLAKRYAKAMVDLGQEKDNLAEYAQSLTTLSGLMESSEDFREVMINPVFTVDDKKKIAGRVLDQMKTDPMVVNFISLLIDRKRIDQLPGIAVAFAAMLDEIRGITRAQVTSAAALGDDELARVTKVLSGLSGKQVELTSAVDPSLLGGLTAKVGDTVYDGTIRTQLNQLKESLKG